MAEAKTPLAPGVIVAETYEIERVLGRGGMGEVWLARHRRLAGKQVAVKVLSAAKEHLTQEIVSRFRREAEIAARLEHPNIVQVIDFNQLPSGEPYLVMELLKGESLASRMRGGALPVEQAQSIIRQVGAALQAAHAHGVVHRDLKPDNIYLVPTALGDQVKVLDFGISKLSESATVQTTDQQLLGTPLYMSPEQGLGQNKDVGVQSDLFSLGSICYEMLTGRAPFVADNIARIVFRIAYEPHVPVQTLIPDAPPNVIEAIEHALKKDRTERTQDIVTFVREFTGQQLEPIAGSAPTVRGSGVATSGSVGTESVMMGDTMAPRSGVSPAHMAKSVQRPLATPYGQELQNQPLADTVQRPTVPAPTAPAAPGAASKSMAVQLAVITGLVLLGGIAGLLIMSHRPVEPPLTPPLNAQPVKPPVADVPTPVPPTVVTVVAAVDASVALVEESDAGVAVAAHVPTPHQTPKHTESLPELKGEDKATVLDMRAMAQRGEWDSLSRRTGAYLKMESAAGRREGILVLIEAECARSDLTKVNALYNRLEERSSRTRAVEACRRHLKDWSP